MRARRDHCARLGIGEAVSRRLIFSGPRVNVIIQMRRTASTVAVLAIAALIAASRAEPTTESDWTHLSRLIGTRTYAAVSIRGEDVKVGYRTAQPVMMATPRMRMRSLGATRLDGKLGEGAINLAIFLRGGRYYAVVCMYDHDRVEIVDITDPANVTAVSTMRNGDDGYTTLGGARAVRIVNYGTTMSVAIVASARPENGVQLINVTDPAHPTPLSACRHNEAGFLAVGGANDIEVFTIGQRTYAVTVSWAMSSVQLIDITKPARPLAVASVFDGEGGFAGLASPQSIVTFMHGHRTYILVVGFLDEGARAESTEMATRTTRDNYQVDAMR